MCTITALMCFYYKHTILRDAIKINNILDYFVNFKNTYFFACSNLVFECRGRIKCFSHVNYIHTPNAESKPENASLFRATCSHGTGTLGEGDRGSAYSANKVCFLLD